VSRCFTGSVLHVDLNQKSSWVEHPEDDFYRTYGGGSSMGLYYILKGMPKGVDPFAPENVLTMFTGLPTGLAISGQSRLGVSARSPLTGGIGDSQSGGFFPAMLKNSGFDGIVITGRADKPLYLYLHNGQAELRDASHLWGKCTGEVEEILQKEIGDPKIQVLQTGPAGEKLVRFAALLSMHNRANGRTGMGAVMGSKMLKAVVVQGKNRPTAFDPKTISRLNREGTKNIPDAVDILGLQRNGTPDLIVLQNSTGTLPTENYNAGQFDKYLEICGDHLTETILKETDTCFACTVRCKRVVETEYKGRKVDPTYGGPEYETLATFGSYCGIADLKAISLANQICNMYGMDTISSGATIAFAMECFENGLISTADTDGIELRFGNVDAMLEMIEKIGKREGFGNVLAEGSARVAQKIGKNASDYLITAKNMEAPAHMPQAKRSLGFHYAVNSFGADHQSCEHDPMYEEGAGDYYLNRLARLGLNQVQPAYSMNDEKVRFVYLTQVFYSALDSYCLCQFVWGPAWSLFGPDEMVEMLRAATGWDITLEEIMRLGERRLNMMRAFNAREGINRDMDKLPKKFYKPLKGTGPTAGAAWNEADLEPFKDKYYQLAGWDVKTGNPTMQKLAELGLDWITL
jgi:aldehyde:ferredoxin oxidoreductase